MNMGLPNLSIKHHLAPEYDLWAEAITLATQLPFKVTWQWVKSHQDTQKIDNKVIFGPHSRPTTINILCDKLATSAYRLTPPPSMNPLHMPHSQATLSIHGRRIHTHLNDDILYAYHAPALRQHILERTKWTVTTYNTVDWDLTGSYLTPLPNHCRTNAIKYLHDWQNTGSQNKQFQ